MDPATIGASLYYFNRNQDTPPEAPPPPGVVPPKPIPLPDDATVKAAQRKSLDNQRRRKGRMSTILTGAASPLPLTVNLDDPLGGP